MPNFRVEAPVGRVGGLEELLAQLLRDAEQVPVRAFGQDAESATKSGDVKG